MFHLTISPDTSAFFRVSPNSTARFMYFFTNEGSLEKAIHRNVYICYSVADYMKNLSYLLSLTVSIDKFHRHYFPNYYPHSNPPCQLSLWEKTGELGENRKTRREAENSEKTHNFRQSANELFPREIRCLLQTRTYDLSGGSPQICFPFGCAIQIVGNIK